MNGKYNNVDNFEECYLRIRELKESLKVMSDKEVTDYMNQLWFKKCVNLKVSEFMKTRNNAAYLSKAGFDREDLKLIATLFGIAFHRHIQPHHTEKDKTYLMLRYLNQKLITFLVFVNRKFKYNEIREEFNITDSNFNEIESISLEAYTENSDGPEIKKNTKYFKEIKKELANNFESNKKRILEITISKDVCPSVRRAARTLCNKKGLDFLTYGKNYVKENRLDPNDFYLEK